MSIGFVIASQKSKRVRTPNLHRLGLHQLAFGWHNRSRSRGGSGSRGRFGSRLFRRLRLGRLSVLFMRVLMRSVLLWSMLLRLWRRCRALFLSSRLRRGT